MKRLLTQFTRSPFARNLPRLVVTWLLVLLPAYGLLELIRRYKVNFPFLDDWMFVQMFEKEKAGTLTLHDFFMVQMEHRMAFVRAMVMLFHKLWPTDYTKQMMFSWVLLSLTYLNVGLLLKQTVGKPFRVWWPTLALSGMVIFCPVQYRIVLWAMMFQVACPAYFLSTALVALNSRIALWIRWLVGVFAASCATQSFASGILVWVLPLPLVWFGSSFNRGKGRNIFAVLWLGAFATTMALYFTNLKNEVDPAFSYKAGDEETLRRDLAGFFSDPGKSVPYVLRFLGSHLGRGTDFGVMDASLLVGAVSVVIYLLLAAYSVVYWRREELRHRVLPWLLFGAYSIGTAMLVAMGRMWASRSGDNAIAPRYVIHAVPLTVSLIVLVWFIVRDIVATHRSVRRPEVRIMQGAAMILLTVQVLTWVAGWRLMEMWSSSRLRGAVSTRFMQALPSVDDFVPLNRDLARRADEMGLLNPPMIRDTRMENFHRAPKLLSGNTASFRGLSIELDEDNFYGVAHGFACLSSRERVADGVFITRRLPREGRWEIIHVAQVIGMPLFLLDTLAKDTQFVHTPSTNIGQEGLSGFSSRFRLDILPRGVHDIMAWAYDARRNIAYPIPGFYQIDTRGSRPRVKKLGTDPESVHLSKFLETGRAQP